MPGIRDCKGVCQPHHVKRIPFVSQYGRGLVRCVACRVFMWPDGAGVRSSSNGRLLCICCGCPVKHKRAKYTSNKHLRELQIPERIA